MRTIGLIGGTSWESTAVYYRLLNEGVRSRLGGLRSARLVLVSVDFGPFAEAMAAGRWDEVARGLAEAARRLEAAGAHCVALCTNTMHRVADPVRAATDLPFVDIVDEAGRALARRGVTRPLLVATRTTMEHGFYRARLRERFGVEALVPAEPDRDTLQRIIFEELCLGRVRDASRSAVLRMIGQAGREGCDGVIFGCTEIGLLLTAAHTDLPVFDTTAIHCEALLDLALRPVPLESHAA